MDRPIYTRPSNGKKRSRWRTVFIGIILIQFILLGLYLYQRKESPNTVPEKPTNTSISALPSSENATATLELELAASPVLNDQIRAIQHALSKADVKHAYTLIQPLLNTPNATIIDLMGEINIRRLLSSHPMDGKIFYTVKSGDYLQKIARQFNTTVALIKKMNNMQTDTIRVGARLIVFEGSFSILVSKNNNVLDLMLNKQLFKRYPVGTGKFGKTPAVDFFIYDKIIEPPWTRPADNRLIEYGDPENVLGTRWMALRSAENSSLKGFGIHGTWERDSIGAQSSAGCIRMFNEDVEELFDLVPRKSRVTIVE
ncbi:MAG: L,D-transpeptidase family protein [Pontiellaceae bacterium]